MHVGGGLLGSRGDDGTELLRCRAAFGKNDSGILELARGGADVLDDVSDRSLEAFGEVVKLHPASRLQFAILLFALGGLALSLGDSLHFEIFHRVGHLAYLVLAFKPRQLNLEIPDRKLAHCL